MKKYIVAIDGFSACGKSTLAKQIAKHLDLLYVDTGAMYRVVTLYFLRHSVDITNKTEITRHLDKIDFRFDNKRGKNSCLLEGVNVDVEIRSKKVNDYVSEIARLSLVRKKMVAIQRTIGNRKALVMDGRDIGSVVFPNAEVKIFLTAEKAIRVERRMAEYREKGVEISIEEVRQNLEKRDYIDSHRKDSPLIIAQNAIVIDNSYLTRSEQLHLVLKLIHIKTKN